MTPVASAAAATRTASARRSSAGGTAATLRRMSSEVSGKPAIPDPHTTAGKIAILQQRREEAIHAGLGAGRGTPARQGKQTARERIDLLLDPGSFIELDELARHRADDFGVEATVPTATVWSPVSAPRRPAGLRVQPGLHRVRRLAGRGLWEKIVKLMDHALKTGCPLIGINDGGGARIQEGVVALGLFGEIFYRNVIASGVIPQISLIMGPCAGGAVYSPAITDFTLMVEETSHMFITGPDVIKTVTGEEVSFEDLGGAHAHNVKSGVAHYQAKDEDDCLDFARALLSYLPSNNLDDPPPRPTPRPAPEVTDADAALDGLIPDSPNQPYDAHTVIVSVLDDREFLEIHALFAPNICVGFGRIEGAPGRRGRQPADAPRRLPGHRRVGEGGPVRPDLRRLQHPGADLRGRSRLPARYRPGVGRHHPPGRQAHLRLRRGHGPEDHGDHAQGLRRRLRRDGLQAPRRRTSTWPGRPRRSRSWARRAR